MSIIAEEVKRLFADSFNQEQQEYQEGVGDKYLEKNYGIPDSDKEFDNQWNKELLTRQSNVINGKLIAVVKGSSSGTNNDRNSNIYMNPMSLENFEADVRAISDIDGNLYVAQLNGDFIHQTIVNQLKQGDNFQFLAWSRMGNTNNFKESMGGFMIHNSGGFTNLRNKQPFVFYL